MRSKIEMGSDEFILYIRKTKPECATTNIQLGREIAVWLKENSPGCSQTDDVPCLWGESAECLGELGIPTTAAQFSFERRLLPLLYGFLDELASR